MVPIGPADESSRISSSAVSDGPRCGRSTEMEGGPS